MIKPKKKPRFDIPFDRIKDDVFPSKKYELSLVFVDKKFSHRLNKSFRGKDYPTNVLSFPLSKNSGEIFIDLDTAKKEAKEFEMTFREFVIFLFIHGLLHLKGMQHGATMEKRERTLFNSWRDKS